jgi:hypothetical protein
VSFGVRRESGALYLTEARKDNSGAVAPHSKLITLGLIALERLTLQLLLCCYDKSNDPERCRTLF